MVPVLAILCAALAVDPPPPVRVVEATEARLTLELRELASVADGEAVADARLRTVTFTRADATRPWTVESGLDDGEVMGERELIFPPERASLEIAALDGTIGAAVGAGVTVVDLIEGDVAVCIWRGGMIRAVWFADPLVPAAARAGSDKSRKNPLLLLLAARNPSGTPCIRGAIIAAQSRVAAIALPGRRRAAVATARMEQDRVIADIEACAAMVDYAQRGVPPKRSAEYMLYFSLARLLDATPAASASGG